MNLASRIFRVDIRHGRRGGIRMVVQVVGSESMSCSAVQIICANLDSILSIVQQFCLLVTVLLHYKTVQIGRVIFKYV